MCPNPISLRAINIIHYTPCKFLFSISTSKSEKCDLTVIVCGLISHGIIVNHLELLEHYPNSDMI